MRALVCWILLGMALVACGGSSSDSGKMSPGVVYLQNRITQASQAAGMVQPLVFSYFNEKHGEQIEVTVVSGETKNISKYELSGGTTVVFSWTNGTVYSGKLPVTIDGIVTIRVNGLRPPTNSEALIYDMVRR